MRRPLILTRSDIDDILKLIDGSDFLELKLEMGDLKLELRRNGAGPTASAASMVPTPPKNVSAVPVPMAGSVNGEEMPAPLLGTFWHAPRPGADPFVRPGDHVTADTVIGIIEVMKLMNSVPAGRAGVLVEITAPNCMLVEHGQTLIRIQPE